MSHRSKIEEKKRLEKLYHKTGGYLNGAYIDDRGVYRRWWPYSSNNNKSKYYRKITNKKVRRMRYDIVLNGGQYKKIFDLWWTLF